MEKAVRALSFPLFVRLLSVPSLLCLLSLLCCVPAGRPCLQCDRRVRLLHEDYLLAAASATIEDQIELKKILDYAYVTYTTTSNQYSGVIGLCPNKCGLLYQRVMNCLSCQYMLHTCPSTTQDCGEYPVEAAEGGQAVLDCFLPWHSLVVGRTDYHYTWAPGTQRTANLTEGDFRVLVVTEDSSVVLNQLHVDEEGTYRCLLTDGKGTVLSRTHFLLTVTPSPVPTPRSLLTLPSLPPSYDASPISHPPTDLLLVIIIMVTALSLTASLALAIAFGLMTLRQQREEEEREGKR
uniref:Ig-like domain-containing protein n=1 Tax=Oncorhynchus tshawytscha TaxID=74940 RepID=A0AAZ3QRW2_ONCTS